MTYCFYVVVTLNEVTGSRFGFVQGFLGAPMPHYPMNIYHKEQMNLTGWLFINMVQYRILDGSSDFLILKLSDLNKL